ncbi:MAG TPA: hypothetical protein VGN98_07130 [Tianweitania sediminis]|nr:hypothetical protein [Tianweitania sediminis]
MPGTGRMFGQSRQIRMCDAIIGSLRGEIDGGNQIGQVADGEVQRFIHAAREQLASEFLVDDAAGRGVALKDLGA